MFYVCVHCRAVLFFESSAGPFRHCGDTPMEAITITARSEEVSRAGGEYREIVTEIDLGAD